MNNTTRIYIRTLQKLKAMGILRFFGTIDGITHFKKYGVKTRFVNIGKAKRLKRRVYHD